MDNKRVLEICKELKERHNAWFVFTKSTCEDSYENVRYFYLFIGNKIYRTFCPDDWERYFKERFTLELQETTIKNLMYTNKYSIMQNLEILKNRNDNRYARLKKMLVA